MRKMPLVNLIKNNLDIEGKRFEVKAALNGEATVYLYDVIDNWFGVDSQSFVQELAALDCETIHLRIDCPGGDVFDARAMHTAIAQHPARVVAHIDGLAASAATFVAMAADEVRMSDGAMFMIHRAWTMVMGNAEEMRSQADLLEKIDGIIANDYHKKTDIDISQLESWMSSETWFTAQEAHEHGFVDVVIDAQAGTSNSARFDLSAYENAPQPKAVAPDQEPKPVFNARTPLYERLTASL